MIKNMLTTPPIDDLLENAFVWYTDGINYRVNLLSTEGDVPLQTSHCVGRDALALVDERLPIALDAMFEHVARIAANNPEISFPKNILGVKVKQLRSLWENPQKMTFTENQPTMHLSGISKVAVHHGLDHVEVEGFGYRVAYLKVDGGQISYFTERFRETFHVSRNWMASQFEDWGERYDIATAMGYTGIELADMVCSQDLELEPQTVELEAVTFD